MHMINAAKLCIPLYWNTSQTPTLKDWLIRICKVAEMEKLIHIARDTLTRFNKKWACWMHYQTTSEYMNICNPSTEKKKKRSQNRARLCQPQTVIQPQNHLKTKEGSQKCLPPSSHTFPLSPSSLLHPPPHPTQAPTLDTQTPALHTHFTHLSPTCPRSHAWNTLIADPP